jgi:hypothetical protein
MVPGAGCWVQNATFNKNNEPVVSAVFFINLFLRTTSYKNDVAIENFFPIIITPMKKHILNIASILILNGILLPAIGQEIALPAPDKTGGKPLMQVLNERQTTRSFTNDSLTLQQLSDLFMTYSDAAFIAQNIYLYCASANLGCVVRGSVPDNNLAAELGLRPTQRIILAQTVGVPKK